MDVIDVMKESDKICNYLDMPLQHASDSVLKSMRRGITQEKTGKLLTKIRSKVPNVAIRTTPFVDSLEKRKKTTKIYFVGLKK